MKIYDISVPIRLGMPIWPGDPPVSLDKLSAIESGEDVNITQLQMCVHTGTHIDAPNHFLAEGKTIDELSVDPFVGEVFVMEFGQDVDVITDRVLAAHQEISQLAKYTRVLFKTRNSGLWQSHPDTFQADYVGLDASAAIFLESFNLCLIGLDYLSIAAYHDTHQPHQVLLSRDIVLLEGINLTGIDQGKYQLFCAPLLIQGCEGAPARVFLMS